MSPARMALCVAAGLALIAGAAFGAWVDWTWWNPVYGVQVVVIFGAGVILIAALVLDRLVPRLRAVTIVAIAAVVGLGGGLAVGPSREPVVGATGTLTLRLDQPAGNRTTWIASCATVPSGRQFAVQTSESQSIALAGDWQALPSVSLGDMWRDVAEQRTDQIGIWIQLMSSSAFTVKVEPDDILLGSGPASRIEATSLSAASGSIHFSGLVPDPRRGPPVRTPPDVSGTIEWSCSSGQRSR